MEKLRQRPQALRDDLIIEQPNLQGLWQQYSYGICTFLAWGIWLYLWLPLINLVAWLFGAKLFYEQMILLGGYQGLLQDLGLYSLVIFIIGAVLILWARYNQYRFQGKEKRKRTPRYARMEEIEFFEVEEDVLKMVQTSKRIYVSFDEEGDPVRFEQEKPEEKVDPSI